jgi:prepilin-type N-terminal cleavage/methylation domain-containing protein
MKQGFTLLEVLLSLALISILAGTTITVYQSFQVKNDLNIAANTLVQTAHRAQTLARAVDSDSVWGVHVQSGANITLFKGNDYNARDTEYDELFDLPQTITSSGLSTIIFSKLTGDPDTTGSFQLHASTGESRTLTINAKGVITY